MLALRRRRSTHAAAQPDGFAHEQLRARTVSRTSQLHANSVAHEQRRARTTHRLTRILDKKQKRGSRSRRALCFEAVAS